jgi:hypothetical protein
MPFVDDFHAKRWENDIRQNIRAGKLDYNLIGFEKLSQIEEYEKICQLDCG